MKKHNETKKTQPRKTVSPLPLILIGLVLVGIISATFLSQYETRLTSKAENPSPTPIPTVPVGNIDAFCLGKGGNTGVATALCLPWGQQISSPINGVGRSNGAHYCCQTCNAATAGNWDNTCYRPVDPNNNYRGSCYSDAGVTFPLRCKQDPSDSKWKWVSENDIGECNTICAVGSVPTPTAGPSPTVGPSPTPTLTPTAGPSPTPTPAGNSCTLSNQTPAMTQECVDCIYNKRSDVRSAKPPECNSNQIVQHWCNGGMGDPAKNDCNNMKTDATKCGDTQHKCSVAPTIIPSPTPTSISSTPTPTVPASCNLPNLNNKINIVCSACIISFNENARNAVITTRITYPACTTEQVVTNWCNNNQTDCNNVKNNAGAPCKIICDVTSGINSSYSNQAYQAVVDGYQKGILNALQVSIFVVNASRTPRLQTVFCNPAAGECDMPE